MLQKEGLGSGIWLGWRRHWQVLGNSFHFPVHIYMHLQLSVSKIKIQTAFQDSD